MKPLLMFSLLVCFAVCVNAAPPALRVDGNRLKTPDGRVVRWQGVNVASMEWSSKGEHVLQSIPEAIDNWGANTIRLPLAQDGH